MKTLLIVYHSMTGGTLQMARAAAEGAAAEAALKVELLHAPDAGANDLMGADGYIFATPENLAQALLNLAGNKQKLEEMRQAFADMHHALKQDTASKAAAVVLQYL